MDNCVIRFLKRVYNILKEWFSNLWNSNDNNDMISEVMVAILEKNDKKVKELLDDKENKIEMKTQFDKNGNNALNYLIMYNKDHKLDKETLKNLVTFNNIKYKNKNGKTSLDLAKLYKCEDIEELIQFKIQGIINKKENKETVIEITEKLSCVSSEDEIESKISDTKSVSSDNGYIII